MKKPTPPIDTGCLEDAARMLRVIAHPVRLGIIQALKNGEEISVGELQARLGVTQSMTSQHLNLLKSIGIVGFRKEANVCYYYLGNKKVLKLLDCLSRSCR